MKGNIAMHGTASLRSALALVAFVAASLAIGWVGAWITAPAIPGWYAGLVRPTFAPPNLVFAPVWTTLYLMIALAAWLVWRLPASPPRARALWLFALQLALNTLWSFLFFGLQRIDAALVELAVLWLAALATIAAFARLSRAASWLLVPYLLWTSFALALNAAFWRLNP